MKNLSICFTLCLIGWSLGASLMHKEAQPEAAQNFLSQEEVRNGTMSFNNQPEELSVTQFSNNGGDMESAYASIQKDNRERSKENRLQEIKNYVLSQVGYLRNSPPANNTLTTNQVEKMVGMLEKFNQKEVLQWGAAAGYTGKVQSFYPSCSLPKNTDDESWNDEELFHIFVDLSSLKSKDGNVNVISAKLRLYKMSQDGSNGSDESSEPCTSSSDGLVSSPTAPDLFKGLFRDERIRVSIYWYTRALKKHRVAKRKLLDTRMLSVRGEEWISFTILRAVRGWSESQKNFGLVVEVENEDGDLLPASKYFAQMNCTEETATARPIPGFLIDSPMLQDGASSLDEPSTTALAYLPLFPTVDICTMEMEANDANYASARRLITPHHHFYAGGVRKTTYRHAESHPLADNSMATLLPAYNHKTQEREENKEKELPVAANDFDSATEVIADGPSRDEPAQRDSGDLNIPEVVKSNNKHQRSNKGRQHRRHHHGSNRRWNSKRDEMTSSTTMASTESETQGIIDEASDYIDDWPKGQVIEELEDQSKHNGIILQKLYTNHGGQLISHQSR